MKLGVVIQGPLVSTGRTGATVDVSIEQTTETDIVVYDCLPAINSIWQHHREYADDLIVVLWSNEPAEKVEAVRAIVGDKHIVIVDDDTKTVHDRNSKLLPTNNKLRQFRSTLAGIQALEKRGCDTILKVRSDQIGNFAPLIEVFRKLAATSPKTAQRKVILPAYRVGNPIHFMDFYFVAHLTTLKNLCHNFLNNQEIHDSIHIDLFFRCANMLGTKSLYPASILAKFRHTRASLTFAAKAWQAHFMPGSKETYRSIIWRGACFTEDHIKMHIFDEEFPSRPHSALTELKGGKPLPIAYLRSLIQFSHNQVN
ncbi:MAG: hypothetical protein ABF335_01795 [Alphaproteobacteria bacterium]